MKVKRLLHCQAALCLGIAFLSPALLASQAPVGALSGQIVDEAGDPMQAIVRLRDYPTLGALSDRDGRFFLSEVPVGSRTVLATRLGHDFDVAFVEVEEGRSHEVELQLQRKPVVFEGDDVPRPGAEAAQTATSLLVPLLNFLADGDQIRSSWPELTEGDTLLVWADWMVGGEPVVVGRAPALKVVQQCDACVERSFRTFEGGRRYVTAETHLRLRARAVENGARRIEFCGEVAPPGDIFGGPCLPLSAGFRMSYVERSPDDWVVITVP